MRRLHLLVLGCTDATTRRALLTLLSAALVVLSFPPFGLWPLAFVALVPLRFALRAGRAAQAALVGFGFGVVAALALFSWLLAVPFVRGHHLAAFAVWFALFPATLAAAWSRLPARHSLPLVPAIAVGLDWIRGHAGFLAFPFATMGQTQHENLPLLQWASVGGEHLVTFAVVAVNVAIAELLERRRAAGARPIVTLGLVALCHVLGAAMAPDAGGKTLRVAAVQPDFEPGAPPVDSFERLTHLTRRAAASGPDLVVWPESAAGDVERDMLALFRTRAIVDSAGVPVLFGSSSSGSERGYNSLFLMSPGQPMPAPYRKVRLVPFAEYAPVASGVGPRGFDTIAGTARFTYDVGGVDVEPLVCFESLFADDVRATASARPSVIALAANDAWFGKSAGPAMHNLVSAFRAVENRRPVVIASTAGPSAVIDASGRVVARARAFEPDAISATVRVDAPAGLYRRWGDLVPLVLIIGLVVVSLAASRFEARRAAQSSSGIPASASRELATWGRSMRCSK